MRWILAMAYLMMNGPKYSDSTQVLVMLNKMTKGQGGTVAEGWYIKLSNNKIPAEEKTFSKLLDGFTKAFVLKNLEDQAHQSIYSL